MRTHEFQAKAIFESYGIPIPKSFLISNEWEIVPLLQRIETDQVVIKAQVHAGGRGKAGGVMFSDSVDEASKIIKSMLSSRLVTEQTGTRGLPVNHVLIEETCEILKEYYLSISIDRNEKSIVLLVSQSGGMGFETLAKNDAAVMKKYILKGKTLPEYLVLNVLNGLGIEKQHLLFWKELLQNLLTLFYDNDLSLVEINPLVLSKDGHWFALDAKLVLDDNAVFRHPDLEYLRDANQNTPEEVEAESLGLSYVALDGTIGCLVNGAGLAMATMDAIKLAGGKPANFLDIGGNATEETVADGLSILLRHPDVRVILVNIFGGIVRCDVVASGIIRALRLNSIGKPMVVRIEGSMQDEAKKMISDFSGEIDFALGLNEAANSIVSLDKKVVNEHIC